MFPTKWPSCPSMSFHPQKTTGGAVPQLMNIDGIHPEMTLKIPKFADGNGKMRVRSWDDLTSRWWTHKILQLVSLRDFETAKILHEFTLEFSLRFLGCAAWHFWGYITISVCYKGKCLSTVEVTVMTSNICRLLWPLGVWLVQTLPISLALTVCVSPNLPWNSKA